MKKSTIYILSAALIIFIGLFILHPLSGNILTSSYESKEPIGTISKLMMKLGKPDTVQPTNLQHIEHIIINGSGKGQRGFIEIRQGDKNQIWKAKTPYLATLNSKIEGNTIIINETNDSYFNLHLNIASPSIKSITLNNASFYCDVIAQGESQVTMPQINVGKNGTLNIRTGTDRQQMLLSKLKIEAKEESIVKLANLKIQDLNATLTNARMDLSPNLIADSVNINLQGLSHVIRPRDSKNISVFNLTGETAYYDARYPKK